MDGLRTTARARVAPPRTGRGAAAWCVRWRAVPGARLRLFCAPHAGAGAGVYRAWAERLAPGIEVVALRPPGRETRFGEPLLGSVAEMLPPLLDEIEDWLDVPYAWFGHSLGSIVAFECCRALAGRGAPPHRLLVSGRPAPHLPARLPPFHRLPDTELAELMRGYGGTPAEVLDDPSALAVLLPVLRADLTASENYRYRPGAPLECPISVFGGEDDRFADRADVAAWGMHSRDAAVVRMLPGSHFFLHERPERILPLIVRDLAAVE